MHKVLPKWVEELKDKWAQGQFTDMSHFGTAILNAKAIGSCETLDILMSLDYEAFIMELGYEPPRPVEE